MDLAGCADGICVKRVLSSKLPSDSEYVPNHIRRRKKTLLLFDGSGLCLLLTASLYWCVSGVYHLKINEICAKNISSASPGGYVELRNDGRFPCQITQMYLSDDQSDLKKWEIPSGKIGAGELLLIPMDDYPFSVSKSGGSILILSDQSGSVVDKVVIEKSRQGDYAYSWSEADKEWLYMQPSPGAANTDAAARVEKPQFSTASGFYEEAFDVTLLAESGAEIHYTTDGSTATADSALYTGPIHVHDRSSEANRWRSIQNITYDWLDTEMDTTRVKKAFVIRAVAVSEDGAVSAETAASYFVGEKFDTDRAVISLVADEDDLFGADGIYSTGETYDNWYLNGGTGERPQANFDIHGLECPVNIEFFMDGKALYFAQSGGLRVQGGSTRLLPLKRFSVFSRKEYSGKSVFPKEIFNGKATHSVALRDGFANAFSMYTIPDRDVAVQQSLPVTVYLNGEYWYDTYMQEKYNDTFFRQTYGVKNVEFYKTGITDDIKDYLSRHDLSNSSDYDGFGAIVDIQSYIDYICTNVYLANTDYSEYGNVAMWRTSAKENDSYGDGRWRWCLYDMDLQTAGCRENYGMTDITDAQVDSFNIVCDWDPPVNQRQIYTALKANADFRRQFVLSFMDMINTDFTVERMTELLEQWGEDISYDEYFFRDRPQYMQTFIAKEFGLKGSVQPLTVNISDESAGYVIVNTSQPSFTDGSWTGQYFTDYPVTVTAYANPGYRFAGWEGSGDDTSETIEISVNGGVTVSAIFEKE